MGMQSVAQRRDAAGDDIADDLAVHLAFLCQVKNFG